MFWHGTNPLRWQREFLPLGISFFTFEFYHYAFDRRAGKTESGSLGEYLAFILFFPTMVAGPIKRYQDFLPKLRAKPVGWNLDWERGITRILTGLVKNLRSQIFSLPGPTTSTGKISCWPTAAYCSCGPLRTESKSMPISPAIPTLQLVRRACSASECQRTLTGLMAGAISSASGSAGTSRSRAGSPITSISRWEARGSPHHAFTPISSLSCSSVGFGMARDLTLLCGASCMESCWRAIAFGANYEVSPAIILLQFSQAACSRLFWSTQHGHSSAWICLLLCCSSGGSFFVDTHHLARHF